jgi:hypothetical protein
MKWRRADRVMPMSSKQMIAVVAIGLAVAGCAPSHQLPPSTSTKTQTVTPTPPPLSVQVQKWYSGVQPYFSELADAGHNMATAAQNEDLTGFGIACQRLHDAAADIQDHMPTPDPDLTKQVQGAISDFNAASHFCMAGSTNLDVGELADALPLLASANSKMDTAMSILQRDAGITQPTRAEPSSTTAQATTLRPPSGADEQGFLESYARCDPGNPPALMASTAKSLVVVCQTGPGNYYYRGVNRSDGQHIELANAVRYSYGFDVTNPADGTQYQMRPDVLKIISPNGHVDSEPMVQYVSS